MKILNLKPNNKVQHKIPKMKNYMKKDLDKRKKKNK